MYQRVIIVGRLGRDPEMRYTAQGTPVTSFSVATDRVWNDQNGQRQESTTWWRVSVFGRQAETANQYLSKGRMVLIEGEVQEPKPYQSRDGEWRASLDLRAFSVKFLGGRGEGGGGGAAPQGGSTEEAPDHTTSGPILDEEEIPF
jgi:single-strand DNA-binding protein